MYFDTSTVCYDVGVSLCPDCLTDSTYYKTSSNRQSTVDYLKTENDTKSY